MDYAVDPAVEGDRAVTERAEGDGDRRAADLVVDYFVVDEDGEGVGAGIIVDIDDDYRLFRIDFESGILD